MSVVTVCFNHVLSCRGSKWPVAGGGRPSGETGTSNCVSEFCICEKKVSVAINKKGLNEK